MKKKSLYTLVALMTCATLLGGCGKKDNDPPAPDVEQVTTIEEEPEAPEETEEETSEVVKPSTGEMLEKIEYEDTDREARVYPDEADKEAIYEMSLEFIRLKDSEKYAQLNAAIEQEHKDCYHALEGDFETYLSYLSDEDLDPDRYEYFELPFPMECTILVHRNDTHIFSFTEDYYQFYGTAHPNSWQDTRNFDPETGDRLKLRDVSENYDKLYDEVLYRIENNGAVEYYYDDYEQTVYDSFYTTDPNWFFSGNGLHVIYGTYVLGAYVLGPIEIDIPYTECSGLIKDHYILTEKQAMALYNADWSIKPENKWDDLDGQAEDADNGYPGFPAEGEAEPEYISDVVMPGYESVNYRNLQGTWIHEYKEDGSNFVEMLVVNGKHGKLITTKDGKFTSYWNAEGDLTITDRSSSGKSPKVSVLAPDGDGGTIYIRKVTSEYFEDAGFNFNWIKADKDSQHNFLTDTVNLENLVGTWYCREERDGDEYLHILAIGENGHASYRMILEGYEVPIVDMPYADLYIQTGGTDYPVLEIQGPEQEVTICVASVDDTSFYAYEWNQWFVRR